MACEHIYIFKGDDTNWNNEQFLTVNITSEVVDLSEMKAKFILGNYSETYSLAEGSFKVDLSHAVTSVYSYGPIDGIIQILDSQNRIKTVSNTIPFYVTNKVQDAQDAEYNVEVSPNSPLDIDISIGYGTVGWGEITGNIQNQTDLQAALYSKVSKIGDTMTGDLTLADGASVALPDGKLSSDDGMLELMGQQYGLKVDTTSGLGAALLTTHGIGEILTSLDLKNTYSATGTDPVTGKAVAQAISTKQDNLTAAQLTAVNSGIDSAKVAQIATNTQAISDEAAARINADNGLQTQIDGLSAASDVTDVVGTYAELQAYDTSKLKDNDIVKVLQDSTHDNAPSYYRWSTHTDTFTYIGSESASYTKAQADAKFLTQTSAASTYETQTAATAALALKASNADGTTITDNGTNITTVAVKEQNAGTAIKEWVGTSAQYTAITTKDANTLYTVTDEADTQPIVVDSALSSTSTNPVQNKAVYAALQNIDALPSQTGQSGKYLTTDGTTASWGTVQSGGIQNEATSSGALAIGGYNSTVGSSKGTNNTVLIGTSAQAKDSNTSYPSVVIGYGANGKNHTVAIGRAANANSTSSTYNTAVGARTDADNSSVAVGYYAKSYINAVAIGGGTSTSARTYANGDSAIAIGKQAVAEGTNTIQIGTGTNSTAGTVQIMSYPLLDATGKIVADRLPSGGGALTFITDKMGNTLDLTGLGTPSKVFKNGLLLQPYTDVTKHYFSAQSNGQYVKIDDYIDFHSADNWLISFKAKNTSSWSENRMVTTALADWSVPTIAAVNSQQVFIFLSSNGTSWDIASGTISSASLLADTEPLFLVGFTGTEYYVDVTYDEGVNIQRFISISNSTKIYSNSTTSRFALVNNPLGDRLSPSMSMPIEDFKVFTNNTLVFNGATAVAGTNYTNYGCTETTVTGPSNSGYKVSGTDLVFTEDLLPTDTLALEF